MKNLLPPALAAVLVVIGMLTMAAFFVLSLSGQDISNRLLTLVGAFILVILGIYSLVSWFRNRN